MSSPVLPLTWHLTKSSGRRGLQSHLLAAGAAAVGAFVMLVIVAATLGAGTRADHTKWRTPDAVPAKQATAVQALATTYVRHEPVTVVSLAQLPDREQTPAPPGLNSFPKQGEVYVSPALADLLRELPVNQLADRLPKVKSYGTIGTAGLAAPDELVAIVGRTPNAPAVSKAAGDTSSWFDFGQTERAKISGFTGDTPSMFTSGDQGIAVMGVILLAMPVVVLSAAAGRLGAARREQRLAALRLAGATPRQIIAMTALEATALGAVGALTGALAYVVLLPALAQVPFGVGTWYVDTLWVGLPWLATVVVAVTALITVSAVSMLRQVANSPLGVAQQADPRRTRMIRLAFFAASLAVIFLFSGGGLEAKQAVALLLLFYGAFWLFGPWVVDRLGRLVSRFAKRPATLLAGRRLSDDPRGAWRTVSGLVLAGFAAGFFSVSMLGTDTSQYRGQIAVSTANASEARHAATEARTLLSRAGVTATVTTGRADVYDNLLSGGPGVIAHVEGGQEQLDTAVTALTPLGDGRFPYGQDYAGGSDKAAFDRLDAVAFGTLALSFLVAAASAGLTAAANVLDRRRVYGLLRLAGTPLKVLDRARVRETVIPLVVLAGGTTAMGAYGSYQLNKAAGATINTSGAIELVVCVVIGAVAMFAAISGSRPLLRKVTADPAQTAD
ncbi:efflux ABC transporter, permease [Streptomyces viridochromogenes]|uniref:Efflux ABC transporter, permease n=1 Tax=Streptomyces viridochromogenes TaxID=1938 RepID=A0A0J7ZJX8_STRVR|nr:ABC transporter permease [Streptomyces viridochromogenes]KMS76189.1 efflux ABC transporter, permease [Streptomyces viridochromogenes]KOG25018.1 efflux ABC transporter, permease [Streptomyces viridochromogenes]KOG26485.1 efflux ABC transporter, permease [Streptomyces viridochromogenes]